MVGFLLVMIAGITVDEYCTRTVFYGKGDPAFFWTIFSLCMLILLIVIGNEAHYRKLKNGTSS